MIKILKNNNFDYGIDVNLEHQHDFVPKSEAIKKYIDSITEETAYEDEKKLDQKFFKIDTQLIKKLPKETPSKLKDSKIYDDTIPDPDSVMNFRSKYLKYKKKYLELKNKLNL